MSQARPAASYRAARRKALRAEQRQVRKLRKHNRWAARANATPTMELPASLTSPPYTNPWLRAIRLTHR